MDRRNILKNILKAALVGVALTGSQRAMATALGFNKYAEMVRLQVDIVEFCEGLDDSSRFRNDVVTSKMDHILGFSLANFDGDTESDEAKAATKICFHSQDWDTMSEEGLRKIIDVVIPIAVARNLLARKRISFDPSATKNWNLFAKKYCKLILEA